MEAGSGAKRSQVAPRGEKRSGGWSRESESAYCRMHVSSGRVCLTVPNRSFVDYAVVLRSILTIVRTARMRFRTAAVTTGVPGAVEQSIAAP
jgi:hypothetical protein